MFSNIFVWISFLLIRAVFKLFQRLNWKLNGLAKQLALNQHAGYGGSAQVLNIVSKRINTLSRVTTRKHFIATHSHFEHPNAVLPEEVTLYCITEDEAVFVRAGKGVYVNDSKIHPFLSLAQFKHAEQMIILPIKHFHRLAAELGNPTRPVIHMANTGRCGSTLLSQMFEQVPGVISFAEPYVFCNIHFMEASGTIDRKQANHYAQSCVRLLCKSRSEDTSMFFIKQRPSSDCIEYMTAALPSVKHVFMYRANALNCAVSYWKFYRTMEVGMMYKIKESWLVKTLCPSIAKYICETLMTLNCTIVWWNKEDSQSDLPFLDILYLRYARKCQIYAARRNKHNIAGIRYEDLIHNTKNACRAIAEHCNLTEEFVKLAPLALGKDSQEGMIISRKQLAKLDLPIDDRTKQRLTDLCREFCIPTFDKEWCLPGTITAPTNAMSRLTCCA